MVAILLLQIKFNHVIACVGVLEKEELLLPFLFYRPKDGKEDLGPPAYAIRNSLYSGVYDTP